MSWFSRIRVNLSGLAHDEVNRLVNGDTYLHHALLWRAFAADGAARDFVFRVDPGEQGLPQYFVVSQRAPQPVAGLLIESKSFAPQLSLGEHLAFTLRANPTVARAQGRDKHSARDDVMMSVKYRLRDTLAPAQLAGKMQQAAIDWLTTRSPGFGLEITGLEVMADRQQLLQHHGREIRFSEVDYQGVATVTQPEKLLQALQTGVGRARGFGCGLLMVRKLI